MEGEVAKRRVKMISGHFAPSNSSDDLSATHLLPMNCSSSLNSVVRRYDNRMYFARQGSGSQGFFMRPSSVEQSSAAQSGVPLKSSVSATEGYCNASEVPRFSRPSKIEPNSVNHRVTHSRPANDGYYSACEVPMFSRPAKIEPNLPAFVPNPPKFARPNGRMSEHQQFLSAKKYPTFNVFHAGNDGSPRMEVVESGSNYVMMVKIPGVDANDIRVEVNDQHLTVLGKPTTKCWTMAGCPYSAISAYHKKGIVQGPYRFTWPLPRNVNKDSVSSEFLDGFLHIVIPKL